MEVRGHELNSRVHKTDSEVRNAGEWRVQVSVRVSQEERTELEKKVFVSEPAMGVIAEAGGRAARQKAASVWLVFRETASLDVVSKLMAI